MVDTALEELVEKALLNVSLTHKEDHAGRVVAGLGRSTDDKRRQLGGMLMAACAQAHSPEYGKYLASLVGGSAPTKPAAAASVTPEAAPRPEYTRPNGVVYFGRRWGKYWDVEVLQKGRETEQAILLIGPPGTGKTSMAEAAFSADLITVVIAGETRVGDLVGGFIPDGSGGWRWVDGPLLTAVREGRPILLDEILLGDPKVLSVLYPLMDGRGFLDVTENPDIGVVPAAKGFYIIGAGNPNVPGARMSEALVSRFPVHVEVTTDWDLAVSLGVDENIVNFASALAARQASGTVSWAPQLRELLAFHSIETVWGREFAMHNLLRIVPRGDYEEVKTLASTVFPGSMVKPARI